MIIKWNHKMIMCSFLSASTLALVTVGQAVVAQDAGNLVFITTGGAYQKAQEEAVFTPFAEETGIEVTFVTASDAEKWPKIQGMAQIGNMQWDLMETVPADYFVEDKVKHLVDYGDKCEMVPVAYEDGVEDTCSRYGVLPLVGATLLAYNSSMFPEGAGPSGWEDFWNIEEFPGPRALQNFGTPFRVLVGALVADGVPRDDLFPMDLDRAFAKLDEIKPQVVLWWSTGDQIQRAFRDGEVTFGQTWATRMTFLQEEGVPITPIWNGATLNEGRWSILKGAPNEDNAIRFMNWYYDHPEVQYNFAQKIKAIPVTKSGLAQYPEGVEPPSFDNVIQIDHKWLGEHEAEILERWNAWIAG